MTVKVSARPEAALKHGWEVSVTNAGGQRGFHLPRPDRGDYTGTSCVRGGP